MVVGPACGSLHVPAEASIVQFSACFRASRRSVSWTMDLYDSSLYLWAASMNFLLKSSTLA